MDIRTLGVQAGHQGLRQGPGMAKELLGADLGRQVCTSGGRKTYRMGKNIQLRQGSSLPGSLGTTAAVPQGSHVTRSGCSRGEITRFLSVRTPPLPPLMPVRLQTRPWAPPFPHQTQKGHLRPEHVPTSPQPPGTDASLQPPAFCCSRYGDMSKAVKESSLQPPRPQKQQCRI